MVYLEDQWVSKANLRLFLVRVLGTRKALLAIEGKSGIETSDEADDDVIITQLWHC